jgi:Fic family protein
MLTLRRFSSEYHSIPALNSWYLSDLGEAKGKQELFTKQSPQKLKVLREHAIIESSVSSNRIEGIQIEQKRVATVVFGKSLLKDRDEEEVRGYRKALRWIHEEGKVIPLSEKTIRRLHELTRGDIWDAGKYKEKDGDIVEKYPDGRQRLRFKTVPAKETPAVMKELLELHQACAKEKWVQPLVAAAVFNLDFLCVHPFRDGNGRVSRLLLLLQCHQLGYEVGRFISLERLIEENKDRYYETLEESSKGWHGGRQDPWPYVNYLLFILKTAYKELEARVEAAATPKGGKTDQVLTAIAKAGGTFRVSDLQRECPGVGVDMIRKVLKDLKSSGRVVCLNRGQSAQWKETRKG